MNTAKPCPIPRPLAAILATMLAAAVVLALTGCMAYVGEKGPRARFGAAANESVQTLDDRDAGLLTKAGDTAPLPPVPESTGSDLMEVILYALLGLGGLGAGGYGVKRLARKEATTAVDLYAPSYDHVLDTARAVAASVVSEYDGKPFTPEDIASIKAAEQVAANPNAPTLKPVDPGVHF